MHNDLVFDIKKFAILLMGPTASGKTALAIALAKIYPIEIVSVDSALVYRDMNIGTAKPTIAEQTLIRHHLIDLISPLESYSVADFLKDAMRAASDILSRGKIPLFVGGTMMYYNALINGISELPASNPQVRSQIEEILLHKGVNYLYEELKNVDPLISQKIMPTDTQRIIRALEVYQLTNVPMSTLQHQIKPKINHDLNFLGFRIIPNNREVLHNRINTRFLQMLNNGFIDEVQNIRNRYPNLTINHTSMRSVGYKHVWQYLDKEISYDDLLQMGQAATRQLAKRQLTWLKNMNYANVIKLINLNDLETVNNLDMEITANIEKILTNL